MPAREPGEPLQKYISRFVKNKHEEEEFPEIRQRLAVGYKEAGKARKKRKSASA